MVAQEAPMYEKHKPSTEMQSLQTVASLAQYGYRHNSPTALIEAARILGTTQCQDADYNAVSDSSVEGGAEKETGISYDPEQLLLNAKEIAGNDEELLALIKRTETEIKDFAKESRGAFGGPRTSKTRVNAYATDVYTIRFWGDEFAEVALMGDGDTDLDLYIYDENGNLVAKDLSSTDACYCCWFPSRTAVYIIKVKNLGGVYNRYHLATN